MRWFTFEFQNNYSIDLKWPKFGILWFVYFRGLMLPHTVKDKYGVSRTDAGNLGVGIYFSNNVR